VIRVRIHLLLVKLPYTAEGLRPQLEALIAALPQGCRRVINLDQVIGFLVPYTVIADIQALRWRKVMQPFSNWWIVGLNGELACKNKSDDPFRTWMDEFRRTGTIAKGEEPEDMPFAQGREPRVEPSVNDLIERTFGKVGLKSAAEKKGPQNSD
jgi:hypothetical protein